MKTAYIILLLILWLPTWAKLPALLSIAPNPSTSQPALISEFIPAHAIDTQSLLQFLKQHHGPWLSDAGHISIINKPKQIVLIDDAKHIARVHKLLKHFQPSAQQIRLRAQVVSIDEHYLQDIGVNFSSHQHAGEITVSTTQLAPSTIDITLKALSRQGHARIIASPMLMTLNNHTALIESGQEVPYQQRNPNGGTSVSFKKAVLKLSVTPSLLAHQRIGLAIDIHQDQLTTIVVHGTPVIHTEQIKTQAIISNQHTLILGGILQQQQSQHNQGITGLSTIPIFGHLFEQKKSVTDTQELLIFITPSLIAPQQ